MSPLMPPLATTDRCAGKQVAPAAPYVRLTVRFLQRATAAIPLCSRPPYLTRFEVTYVSPVSAIFATSE